MIIDEFQQILQFSFSQTSRGISLLSKLSDKHDQAMIYNPRNLPYWSTNDIESKRFNLTDDLRDLSFSPTNSSGDNLLRYIIRLIVWSAIATFQNLAVIAGIPTDQF